MRETGGRPEGERQEGERQEGERVREAGRDATRMLQSGFFPLSFLGYFKASESSVCVCGGGFL